MSYYYNGNYTPSLWDIIEALQNQAAASEQAPPPRQAPPPPQAAAPQRPRGNAPGRSIPQGRNPYAAAAAAAAPPATAPPPPQPASSVEKSTEKISSPFVLKPVSRTDVFLPSIDVYDLEETYKLYVSIPGARKTSIEVHFNPDSNELTIEGEVPPPQGIKVNAFGQPVSSGSKKDPQLLLRERESGPFARTLHLPSEPKVDDEGISAKFNAGVLEISIPKRTGAAPVRRKITVEDVDDEELIAEAQEDVE